MTHHFRGTHTLPDSHAGTNNFEPTERANAAERGSHQLAKAMLKAFEAIAIRDRLTLVEAMHSQLYPGVL